MKALDFSGECGLVEGTRGPVAKPDPDRVDAVNQSVPDGVSPASLQLRQQDDHLSKNNTEGPLTVISRHNIALLKVCRKTKAE